MFPYSNKVANITSGRNKVRHDNNNNNFRDSIPVTFFPRAARVHSHTPNYTASSLALARCR